MTDYSDKYRRLLDFLQSGYSGDPKEKNYVKYLLSMEFAPSIDEMITIYNNVFRIIPYYIWGKDYKKKQWKIPEYWSGKTYLITELNTCLDENILRWYEKIEEPTKDMCISCLVNLRPCKVLEEIQDKIIRMHGYEGLYDTEIISRRNKIYQLRKKMLNYGKETNEYKDAKKQCLYIINSFEPVGFKRSILEVKQSETLVYIVSVVAIAVIIAIIALVIYLISNILNNGFMGIVIVIGLIGLILSGKIFKMG